MKQPKYQLIAHDLLAKILAGKFSTGKLPSFSSLSESYGTSLMTIRQAVKLLESEGKVSCSSGRSGTRLILPGLQQIRGSESGQLNTFNDNHNYRQRSISLRCLSVPGSTIPVSLFENFIEDFQRQYPWIRIECDYTESPENVDCSSHDIYLLDSFEFHTLAHLVDLLDLDYFPSFPESMVRNLERNDSCLVMLNVPFLYYDSRYISEAPKSWREYMAADSQLRAHSHSSSNLLGFCSLLHCRGGNLRKAVSKKSFSSVVKDVLELLWQHYSHQTDWNNCNSEDIAKSFAEGRISMMLGYILLKYRKTDAATVRLALPPGEQNSIPVNCIRGGIHAQCRHYKEAWLFLNFLRSTEVQLRLAESNLCIPVDKNIFEHEFREHYPQVQRVVKQGIPSLEELDVSTEIKYDIYDFIYREMEKQFRRGRPDEEFVQKCVHFLRLFFALDQAERHICR